MPRFTTEVTINASLDKVWSMFMDVENMPHWMTGFQSIENVGGNPEEVGSQWKMVFEENGRRFELTETVTGYTEKELFAFKIDHTTMWSDTSVRFTTDGQSTTVHSDTDCGGKGLLWKPLLALMSGNMRKRQSRDFERFKGLVEGGRGRAAGAGL